MSDPVQQAADDAGVRLRVSDKERPRSHDLVLDQGGIGHPKWMAAKARIARILEGARQGGASSIAGSIKDAQVPRLAHEFMELTAQYKFGRHRNSKWNPFRDLSDGDSARKFVRMVFDICDRSTGRLGAWWTK